MSDKPLWYCTRQRAGPLVKECRALRPRLAPEDSAQDRRDKCLLRKSPHTAVCRTQADRLELRLALFGYEGSHYTLTFDSLNLPRDFPGVRKAFRAFSARVKRWRKGQPFDYIYCIEGLHGDHRYHIHLILRDSNFAPAEIQFLWGRGLPANHDRRSPPPAPEHPLTPEGALPVSGKGPVAFSVECGDCALSVRAADMEGLRRIYEYAGKLLRDLTAEVRPKEVQNGETVVG